MSVPVINFPPFRPYSNITPFTVRDGATYLSVLEELRNWLNTTLVPHVDTEVANLVIAWEDNANTLLANVITALNEQNDTVTAQLNAQNASILSQLNDQNAAITAQLAAQDASVTDQINTMTAYVDNAVQSIINSTIEVSDPVVLGVLNANGDSTQKVRDLASNTVGILGVPEVSFSSIRATLLTAASLGIHTVLARGEFVHDNGDVIDIPDNVTLRFDPGSTVTVPVEVEKGFARLGNGSRIEGARVNGAGALKTIDVSCFSAIAGTQGISVIDCDVNDWHGTVNSFVDCSGVEISGGTYTNITRTSEGGSAVRVEAVTNDVVDILIENLNVKGCAGTAIQVDGVWNSEHWRTLGSKARNVRVYGVTVDGADYAGVFLNSCFNAVIVGCTVRNCTDYGIGLEFCLNASISGCSSEFNDTFGFAVFQSGQDIAFSGCTTRGNGMHGFMVHHGNVVADTPSAIITLTGCVSEDNVSDGFNVIESEKTIITGCIANNNGSDGWQINGKHVIISACIASNNNYGFNLVGQLQFCKIVDSSAISNINDGIFLGNAIGGAKVSDVEIENSSFRTNGGNGIGSISVDTPRITISDCEFDSNAGFGIAGSVMPFGTIRNSRFLGNGNHALNLIQPFDVIIEGNRFHSAAGRTCIRLVDSAGVSGGRTVVRKNEIHGLNTTDTGIELSVGSNTSAGDDFFVEDNRFLGLPPNVPFAYTNIGSASRLVMRAEVVGTPEGSLVGAPGSIAQRLDGGAGSTFYIKETGVNTNTGWVAK